VLGSTRAAISLCAQRKRWVTRGYGDHGKEDHTEASQSGR
jgi:hypothetical protein